MTARSIGAASLVRLLGSWHAPGRGPLHRQLVEILRLLILDGRLPLAARLPGERELARALGLSRTTVSSAYDALRGAGFLVSRRGSGSVTSIPQQTRPRPSAESAADPDMIDLSIASLPANEAVHHAFASAIAALPAHLPTSGYQSAGLLDLRAAVAERYRELGVPTQPEQVLITQGAQQGLVLLLQTLARPGDRIAVDHPTYPLALDAIQHASCRAVPVALLEGGWDLDALDAALRQTSPRFAYLLPDFHNPTGLCMSEEARERIVAIAAAHRVPLVIDETMADLWLKGERPPPLARFDRNHHVVSLGSMGKTYWGGLRIGWIRAEAQLVAALERVRSSVDLGSPVLEQLAATALLTGDQSPLEHRRASLRRRCDLLLSLVEELLPDWRIGRPRGGLSLWAELPRAGSTLLAAEAGRRMVKIVPGTRFGLDGAFERYVRLPFSLPEEKLELALERLAGAWEELDRLPRRQGETRLEPEHASVI